MTARQPSLGLGRCPPRRGPRRPRVFPLCPAGPHARPRLVAAGLGRKRFRSGKQGAQFRPGLVTVNPIPGILAGPAWPMVRDTISKTVALTIAMCRPNTQRPRFSQTSCIAFPGYPSRLMFTQDFCARSAVLREVPPQPRVCPPECEQRPDTQTRPVRAIGRRAQEGEGRHCQPCEHAMPAMRPAVIAKRAGTDSAGNAMPPAGIRGCHPHPCRAGVASRASSAARRRPRVAERQCGRWERL